MRVPKKLLVFSLIIVLVACMIIPAFAGIEDMPEAQALKIQSIGLLAGEWLILN